MLLSAPQSRQRGFTLVEMLVTLAVLTILLTVAVPTFRDLIRRSQVSFASSALSADLAYARIEAVTRGTSVLVCPSSTDGSGCMNPVLGKSYASGWLVYTYTPGTAVPDEIFLRGSAGGIMLRQTTGLPGVSIQATDGKAIGFDQRGQFKTHDGGGNLRVPPSFLICSTGGIAGGGIGSSTTRVPGTSVLLDASGSVRHAALASGMPCGA